ncbi:polysaccharide deacetylase family protein [Planococcus lenghuensis]|uniref:DUF2334 domain-containing protein n=1 Tax=Planococcus lenghuensis TaxID=2213202 RepID=A0A1Q2L0R8_9BACL|nr:polysaccharide deacetylase family protein [Planococcus lenghuensis]AQQ54029.1 hypothetical protein B0X71_13595 [Planococcus lenghuensis]
MKPVFSMLLLGFSLIFSAVSPAAAEAAANQAKTLIVYKGDAGVQVNELHALDLATGHFASDRTILPLSEAAEEGIAGYSHVLYAGFSEEALSDKELELFREFTGPLYLIGRHIDRFPAVEKLGPDGAEKITAIRNAAGTWEAPVDKLVTRFENTAGWEVLYTAEVAGGELPLILRQGNTFVAVAESVTGPVSDALGETLFDFYQAERQAPKKFLRLEDVHPKSDPIQLRAIGDYLAEQNIPYAITVIPVYLNPQTHEEIRLADEPELVRVLLGMQANGASIILHGYRHQYRDSETGEGFEYWDVEHDRPIYQSKDEPVLLREDFSTDEEFAAFLKQGQAFEESYIRTTVERGIQELTEQRLYPLAFEAPHYSMSETGYRILSDYFSTYVGEIQLSDKTFNGTGISLFETKPVKLHGMQVLPETLGYIEPDNPDAVTELTAQARYAASFSDSYLAFFYHPYLGLDGLKDVLDVLSVYDEYEWVNMKELDNRVVVNGLTISTGDGKITVDRGVGVLVAQTAKDMWWFAVPILVFLLIVITSIRQKRVLRGR